MKEGGKEGGKGHMSERTQGSIGGNNNRIRKVCKGREYGSNMKEMSTQGCI